MASDHSEASVGEPDRDRERPLFAILAAYFESVEAGEAPDRTEWLARYPEWAEDIVGFLDDQDRLLRLTEPLRPEAAASGDSASVVDRGPSGLTADLEHNQTSASLSRNGEVDYPTGTKVRCLGDYVLIGEIARGGMGVVFLARQRSLNRPVAVKMLPAGALMSDADEQRFRREAEAAANLDHPNIVPIFEVGRHDGHSYFSMKLIEGGSLARRLPDFAANHKAAARVIAIVARAVHHAHQRGVLHRDLKPSNILLSGESDTPIGQLEPYVTDFGLAKRVEGDSELTQSGAILGTPSYMAPEQASGRKGVVTVATDVYGLGAVLYTILAGKPPFKGDSVLETITHVKERLPDPPSCHGRRIDRNLETICLKCLEKEPARRYGSAEAVAEDLERWLAGMTILARQTGRAEHAWRWCRRNPVVAGLAGAVASLVVMALVGLLASNRMIARERADAEKQRDEARQAVDDMYTDVAERWLAQQSALEPVHRTFLRKALTYYQRFAGEQSTDPKVRLKTAQAFHRVGIIQQKLSEFGEAEAAYHRESAILEKLVADSPSVLQYRCELAVNLRELGGLLYGTGRPEERVKAEQPLRRAIALQERLVAESPLEPEYRHDLARSYNGLALVVRPPESAQLWRQAIALQETLAADSPSNAKYQLELAKSHGNFGTFTRGPGHYEEAERSLVRSIALWAKLTADSPSEPQLRHGLALSHSNLGFLLEVTGRPGDAEKAYRQAIMHQEKLVSDSPSVPRYRNALFRSHENLGSLLLETGQPGEAENEFRQAVAHQDRVVAEYPAVPQYRNELAAGYDDLGIILTETGHLQDAESAARRAVAIREELTADSASMHQYGTDLALSNKLLGDVLAKAGHPTDAEPAYRRSITLLQKASVSQGEPDFNRLACGRAQLAAALQAEGRAVEAETEYREAIALAEKLTEVEAQNELSRALATSPSRGAHDYQLALQLAKKSVGERPHGGQFWNVLGITHFRTGDWTAAITALEKSMQLRAGGDASDWLFMAMAQKQHGDKKQATKWYTRAIEWMEKHTSTNGDFRRLRSEAEYLLGIADSRMPNGLDAFRKE